MGEGGSGEDMLLSLLLDNGVPVGGVVKEDEDNCYKIEISQ